MKKSASKVIARPGSTFFAAMSSNASVSVEGCSSSAAEITTSDSVIALSALRSVLPEMRRGNDSTGSKRSGIM